MENNNKNNRIKTAILFVLTIITVACIIIGTYRFTGNVKSNIKNSLKEHGITINGFDWDWDFDDEDDFIEIEGKDGKDGNTSVRGAKSVFSNLDAFTNLKIDAKVMSVTIKNGDTLSYSCKFNKDKLKPEVTNENGTLTIKQRGFNHNNGNLNCNLVITVPRYTQLDDVDITLNVAEVDLQGFDCNEIKVTNNVGEINVKDVNFEDLDVKTNVGEINVNTLSPIDEYTINASTNVGEVNVDGRGYRKNASLDGNTSKKISVETNVGEVNIR